MSCCGGKRQQFYRIGAPRRVAQIPARAAAQMGAIPPSARSGVALFEYVGETSLCLVGTNTGRRYRFDAPGARVAVDPRDELALAGVPWLRRLRSS